MSRVRMAVAVLLVIGLALLAGQPAFLMEWTHLGTGGQPETLRLAAYAGDVGALEWIAHDKGLFAKVGLDVDMRGYPSGKAAMASLDAGQADVATAADFVVASESFTDPGLRVLGNISYYRNKGIVGRRDRGIEKPADLKGKRIGVTSPSGAEYTLYVFLAINGLSDKEVTVVNLAPRDMVDALVKGTIDAAMTWQPHVQALQSALGANGVTFDGSVFDVYLLLVTHQQALATKDRALRKLLRALVLAEEWARVNPRQAKDLIVRRFGLQPQAVDAQWRHMQLEVTLPQDLLVAMDGEARWLAKRDGKNPEDIPDYSTFIAAAALRDVKPSAVTLFTDPPAASRVRRPAAVATR